MKLEEIKSYLEQQHNKYNRIDFIENDPILIPHAFTRKEDIEISGFFAATFAWGQRITIINKTKLFLSMMDNDPFQFIENGKTGGINVIDLANLYSCSFIATQDLGKVFGDSFQLLGRFDNSDIRGCNLLIE